MVLQNCYSCNSGDGTLVLSNMSQVMSNMSQVVSCFQLDILSQGVSVPNPVLFPRCHIGPS